MFPTLYRVSRLSPAAVQRRLLSTCQPTNAAPPRRPRPIAPLQPQGKDHNRLRKILATVAAITATTVTVALTEAPPTAPASSRQDTTRTHDWTSLICALRDAQRTSALGSGFRATRRPLSAADGGTTWTHDVEFSLTQDADAHDVVTTLAKGLAGPSGATVHIDESGTLRRMIVKRPGHFEFTICIPRVSPFDRRVAVELMKAPDAHFSEDEVDALVNAYRLSQGVVTTADGTRLFDGKHSVDTGPPTCMDRGHLRNAMPQPFGFAEEEMQTVDTKEVARAKLKELGVEVVESKEELTWDALAGYEDLKQRIEETLTLPLRHPEVYERIVKGTRKRVECNVPKAVLYEGPPGCGKTLSARIMASTIGVPFVHIRIETLLSKFYGETTRKLGEILEAANSLGRCIIFLDECDSVGLKRSSGTNEVHEVTRRTLSVLLRFIDGMDGARDAIVLAATNHKEDLDAALMSRFDVVVSFPLPDLNTRVAVLKLYAKQLTEAEVNRVAELTWGFSGRELVDVCEEAERMRAGAIVRAVVARDGSGAHSASDDELPSVQEYILAVERKAEHVVGRWDEKFANHDDLHCLLHDVALNQVVDADNVEKHGQSTESVSTEN